MEDIILRNGDCLEIMKEIDDKSIDIILCDLPYGTTACKWDVVIPFELLWEQYNRIIKDNGAIVLFGNEPFSSYLRLSNIKNYKYDWVYKKSNVSGFLLAKKQPLRKFENIIVFYKKQPTYNPQFTKGKPYVAIRDGEIEVYGGQKRVSTFNDGKRYPTNILEFANTNERGFHPTQKPVALLEYLIKTYTNENELVLDNCMGSGSTGVACVNTNRRFYGIEKDEHYFEVAKNRIEECVNSKGKD